MNIHTTESEVNVSFTLVGVDGSALKPLSVSYRVTDQDDREVVPLAEIYSSLSPEDPAPLQAVGVLVHPTQNVVADGRAREMRQIELQVTVASGVIRLHDSYILEIRETLKVNGNSFQNYANSVLVGMDIPNVSAWSSADKRNRTAALIQAHKHVTKLRFRYCHDSQSYLRDWVIIRSIDELTDAEWALLPEGFRNSLCRAQVIEADAILGGDEVTEMRLAGLTSKTTGQSSASFRAGTKPVERAVSLRAFKELSKYIDNTMRIGRA